MKHLLRQLVENIFRTHQKQASNLFIESLLKYIKPCTPQEVDEGYIKLMLKQKSYSAFLIYENLKKNVVINNLCYVIINLSNSTPSIVDGLSRNLKKGALGFKISYFSDANIIILRDKVETQIYEIVFQIYQYSCIYLSLKNNLEIKSQAMQYFNKIVIDELKDYERAILEQEEDLLSFYVGMYSSFLKLKIIHQINECFKDTPRAPFTFLKLNLHSNHPFYCKILEASASHINYCIHDFFTTGDFKDESGEFFISKRNSENLWDSYMIDDTLLPHFLTEKIAENILYIGKCMHLLKYICMKNKISKIACTCSFCLSGKNMIFDVNEENKKKLKENSDDPYEDTYYGDIQNVDNFDKFKCIKNHLDEILENTSNINILDVYLKNQVTSISLLIDKIMKVSFLENYNVYEYIEGIRKIFLRGRSDFAETLFQQLKEIRKLTKRSYGYILDSSIESTFGFKDEFLDSLDIYIHDEKSTYDNFSLFSNVPFPINILINREILIDLSKIFKFFWIIKRVEHLLRKANQSAISKNKKIRVISYINVINKYYYYIFEEVISYEMKNLYQNNDRIITNLQSKLMDVIKGITKKMYIDPSTKIFYKLIKELEKSLLRCFSTSVEFDDQSIRKIIEEHTSPEKGVPENSLLYDLNGFFI